MEKLKRIPLGIGSGSGMRRKGRKGLFAAIKDEKNNRHFWLFYDIERNTILNRKLEVIKLIRCQIAARLVHIPSQYNHFLSVQCELERRDTDFSSFYGYHARGDIFIQYGYFFEFKY